MNNMEFHEKYGIWHDQKLFEKLERYIPREITDKILPLNRVSKPVGLYIYKGQESEND